MKLWRMGWRLWRYRPWTAAAGTVLWIVFHTMPFFVGLVLRAIFDRLSGNHAAGLDAYGLVGVFVAVEAVRLTIFFFAWVVWMRSWGIMTTLLRVNMLSSALVGSGAASTRLPSTGAEAVIRFRDDVDDMLWFIDIHLDVAGGVLFTALALAVMAHTDARLTIIAVLPLAAVAIGNRILTTRMRGFRRAYREATATTSAFLGEVFGASLAIKAGGAERRVADRLDVHNRRRNRAAVRDHVSREALMAFNMATIDVAVGVVLLVAAPAMRRGTFTVGDLVLFTAYIEALSGLPRRIGRLLAFKRHADVAVDRMAPIVNGDPEGLTVHAPVYLKAPPPPLTETPPVDDPLRHLEIAGLTARHPGSDRGIEGIDLRIERGDVVVVAGEVGAGKSTLVRALLGIIPVQEGTVAWNGRTIDDPSTFLVPPRAAYLPQVPVLFSESLDDNIRLGVPLGPGELDEALWLAVIESDVAAMDDGLATVVGPRGVRLSGGQQQRAAAARAFVRSSELLVVDDPSSALDVVTEERMWNRLLDRRSATYIVVSNRREVLARADHALVIADGRVAIRGRPEAVMEHPLLLRVWATTQGADGRPRVER